MLGEKWSVGIIALLLALGCGGPDNPASPTDSDPTADATESESGSIPVSEGFSWIVPGELAAMPLPGRDRQLDLDAAYLEQEGIRVLVSLTEEAPDAATLTSRSIEQRHIPVQDFNPPTIEQMIEFVTLVEDSVAAGTPVGVHCTAGLGRSGTMAAAYLVTTGFSPDDAIATVRGLRPGSIETADQEASIHHFAENQGGDG